MNSKNLRTCQVCGAMHQPPEFQKGGLPKKFPAFLPAQQLRLKSIVLFDRLFPGWSEDQNRFKLVGRLADDNCRRTINCTVMFDSKEMIHRYRVRVRCVGMEGDYKTARIKEVWADEVEVVPPEAGDTKKGVR